MVFLHLFGFYCTYRYVLDKTVLFALRDYTSSLVFSNEMKNYFLGGII